jgi:phenylpropionate dioxygenase-like ring-hydroxylating dioxygenase large terminal subunit
LLPLAKGKLIGDSIECGYHGFTFDTAGKCTAIPSYDDIPSSFKTKKYPVEEKGSFVWIWMGNPEAADPARIPDTTLIGIGVENWCAEKVGQLTLRARYQLVIDNFIDLSYVSYIHEESVRDGKYIAEAPVELERVDGTVCITRSGAPPSWILAGRISRASL